MDSKRQQKFSKLIQKELSEIFQRDAKGLFGGAFITVTDVKISPDLGLARAYLSFMMAKDKKELLENIRNNKSKIRNFLGTKIRNQVRIIPNLEFYVDDTADQAARMDEIFAKINLPPSEENNDPEDKNE